MITAILMLALLQPQAPALASPAGAEASVPVDRTEKLTPAEAKALADANKAVADAQDKLIHAKAALQGTTEGIELAHHANTDCGCYIESTGRDYDKVEFKGDSIFIHHIHEAPGSLSNKTTP
jgi:tRNA pseudouridine-54 N-methylase